MKELLLWPIPFLPRCCRWDTGRGTALRMEGAVVGRGVQTRVGLPRFLPTTGLRAMVLTTATARPRPPANKVAMGMGGLSCYFADRTWSLRWSVTGDGPERRTQVLAVQAARYAILWGGVGLCCGWLLPECPTHPLRCRTHQNEVPDATILKAGSA